MTDSLQKREILRMIRDRQVSSTEGLQLLKRLKRGGDGRSAAAAPPNPEIAAGAANGDIAVIGMSGRFPNADTLDEFWENLAGGKDSVREVTEDCRRGTFRLDEGFPYRWAGLLTDVDGFDPLFFNIAPSEAEFMEPEQRIFLQEAWGALEDAGYAPEALDSVKCGVFVGYSFIDYSPALTEERLSEPYAFTGNAASILASRIAYLLNLKGPSIAIDTACSSSLVAVHLACESIRSGTSRMALAGGVQVLASGKFHQLAASVGMLSADGRCKTFDHRADGFVPGEGVGVVVLKPLDTAIHDGDAIHGVIKGSDINQDGKTNGITAPNAPSQSALLLSVYDKFGIRPENIGYVEAHGTGTELGDPIEVRALTHAFRKYTGKRQYCAVGSVKTNIGHTIAAAGISSLIKVLLCIRHRKLVPTLNLEKENSLIGFKDSPFYANTRLLDWQTTGDAPRCAAVSSFGFSGTNAHVVLEEYVETGFSVQGSASSVKAQIVVLSAKNEERLREYAKAMVGYLECMDTEEIDNRQSTIENIAYTLQTGRKAMEKRLALVVSDLPELERKLKQYAVAERDASGCFTGSLIYSTSQSRTEPDGKAEAVLGKDEHRKEDLETLARLWVKGVAVDWNRLWGSNRPRRLSLPTYPFEKQSFAVSASEAGRRADSSGSMQTPCPPVESVERRYFRWMWIPSREDVHIPRQPDDVENLLLFDTDTANRKRLQKQLGSRIFLVTPGSEFKKSGRRTFTINPSDPSDYRRLLDALGRQKKLPTRILHFWSKTPFQADADGTAQQIAYSFTSVVLLLQHLLERDPEDPPRFLYLYVEMEGREQPVYAAMSGFARTVLQEHPGLRFKTVALSDPRIPAEALFAEMQSDNAVEIRYRDHRRWVKVWQQADHAAVPNSDLPFKENGIYLISGGAGGLGLIWADYLAVRFKARLVLAGRSVLDQRIARRLETLKGSGAEAVYIQADVANPEHARRIVSEARDRFGAIQGVIHAAGIIRDARFLNKTTEDAEAVLTPKIFGTLCLDEATSGEPLDFFALFSSVASVTGNPGQSDYSFGNGFMDHYAAWRELKWNEGRRSGKTLCINWPYWGDGGMRIPDALAVEWLEASGIAALPTAEGIAAFNDLVVRSEAPECMVLYGRHGKMIDFLDSEGRVRLLPGGAGTDEDRTRLRERAQDFLRRAMSGILKLPPKDIDPNTPLEFYGLDSVIVKRFNDKMAEMVGPLPKTLLFEYQTLRDLTGYFVRNYSSRLERLFADKEEISEQGIEALPAVLPSIKPSTTAFSTRPPIHHSPAREEEIAIIGIGGRYPSARNLEAFWQNLKEGKDCISEIPQSRFDYRPYYHPDPEMSSEGKIYCKWGGFLEDAETFDPLFFNISPKEAEIIDPQERLFLETAWSTLEDAGYTRDGLRDCRVGTFVGVTTNTYLLWGPDIWRSGEIKSIPASLPWSVANRVSYFFNYKGPSLPVDTACSSALSAIHLACESLRKGECDLALTGGVNLYLHPAKYVQLCQSRMLSPSGRCHTFGIDGDGYVPGEGVGAALLKPLNRAIVDGDHIYAVIKGCAVNHGGKTTGYAVPNPRAQAALILETLEKTRVDPRTISYLEAHGTGTELGDPIEIRGLTKAFRRYTDDRQFCSIGSVKSNIGHSEAAAGISGIHKILLQMKFGQLVPSLHAETFNPNINFKDSPFYVQHELSEWNSHYPRRAAISSFGAGGSNAHIILEEYEEKEFSVQRSGFRGEPQLFVLSAKNEDRLKEYAERMAEFIEHQKSKIQNRKSKIENIAYTLQVGREAMEERLALVISDAKELSGKLRRYINDDADTVNVYAGNIKRNEAVFEQLLEGETGDTFLRMAVERKEYGKIARLWVAGAVIDWRVLHQHRKPNRISLPTYPFARNRYWIPERLAGERKGPKIGSGDGLHPLLDANTSTLKEQKFSKKLTGHEFYLTDHVIGDQKTFPGVAYLEMARAAGEYATEHAVRTLTNIVWVQPILVSEPGQDVSILLHLHPKGEKIAFEVITMAVGEQKRVHAQGNICFEDGGNGEIPFVDLKALRGRFTKRKSGAECYQAYGDAGMHYGTGFRAIQELYVNQTEALSRLVMPASVRKGFTDFALHPSLMDGALQTVIGLAGEATAAVPCVPFSLGEVVSFLPLTETCYAHVVPSEASDGLANRRYSVDILSETGQVLVRLKAFYVRALDSPGEKVHAKTKRNLRDAGDDRQQVLMNRLRGELSAMVSEILKIDGHDVDPDDNISEYGFDSIGFTDFANRINEAYGLEITPAIFFDHASIADLIRFLTTAHPQRFAAYDQGNGTSAPSIERPPAPEAPDIPFEAAHRFFPAAPGRIQEKGLTQAPVAIVGMSAVMPNSSDADCFWKHLKAGADLVSEVPEDRWDWRQNAGGPGAEADTEAFKWGGFISDVDMFDCLFFGISPREAELMDPQQRLFLQVVWNTIEDAGYRASDLAGTATGVFVGVATHDYDELLNRQMIDSHVATGMAHSILANRISYLFDLHGPSEPIDTACSSSLIAIHRAFEAIVGGACEMAIAGGVNLMLSPTATIAFGKAGMLSHDGRCKTFDKSADGYVRGEGTGAILMKPLDAALSSGDHIYAVIRSTAENHGGRAPSLTAPNSTAQSQLLIDAYEKAGIEPDTVGYIETHGTGTQLGDPVEVNGLKNAFDALYRSNGKSPPKSAHCGLGSVKTNIGHLETAAGIASVIKVLLALKHRKIPANAHFREINPYIQLEGSPFYIVTECIDWEPLKDAGGKSLPRRAGVSSFGYGGANAHVVLEEYEEKEVSVQSSGFRGEGIGLEAQSSKVKVESATVRCEGSGVRGEPQLIVLSAKNEDRLRAYAAKMVEFFSTIENRKSKIENIAYTLQVGREAMEDRLATVVSDPAELREKLNRFVRGVSPREGVYSGTARIGDPSLMLEDEEEGREYLRNLFQKKRLEKLGQLWVSGVPIDWSRLHEDGKYRRVSLPTYPFARERYWIPEADGKRDGMGGFREKLHPLVERNTSTLSEQMFSTRLSGREFYLSEHVILDQKVLPGVAYLELARAAGELSDRRPVRALKNVVWMKPIVVSEHPVDVHIGLHPKEENVEFMVFTADENDRRQRHAQGILIFEDPAEQPPVEAVIDIDAIRKRCPKKLTKSEFYAPFKGVGFDLGESFKVVEEIRGSDIDALAVIHLPPNRKTGYHDFALHPSVMDGALQSTIGLIFETFQSPGLPFSLGRLEVLSPMTGHRYFAHALAAETAAPDSEVKRYDILIADESGQVVVSIKDFVGRPLQQKGSGGVYFRPVWLPADISLPEAAPTGPVLLFDLDESRRKAFERQLKTRVIQVYPGERYEVRSDGTYSLRPGRFEDYRKLLASLNQMDCMPRHVLHAWSQAPFSADVSRLDAQLEKGFYSIFHLSRALLELKPLETIQILFFYLEGTDPPQPQYAALSGFGRSIQLETSRLNFKTIALADIKDSPNAASVELSPTDGPEVCYRQGRRWIRRLQAFTPDEPVSASMLREGGVYIITGGGGGLGRIIAGHLLSRVKAHVILTGRSPLDPERSAEIEALGTLGGEIVYIQSDVTRRDHVDTLISTVKGRFGKINGIIHGAGIIRDALLINKKLKAAKAVLGPKVTGTVHLDEATRSESLDFFILFSSIAALTGNIGQCDYAFANSFMDHFAQLREARRIDGTRSGKTVAVNWPLWQGGGMRVDGETEKWMSRTLGTDPLKPDAGLAALFTGLGAADSQFAFVQGDPEKIRKVLMPDTDPHPADETSEEPTQEGSGSLIKKVQTELLPMAAAVVKVDPGIIKAEENFSRYGFESLTFTEFSNRINQKYRLEITPTLFFEYPSLYRFSRFLSETYPQALLKYHGEKDRTPFPASANRALQVEREETEGVGSRNRFDHKRASGGRRQAVSETEPSAQAPVAIIGMSGRMPQSKNPEQFWEHLWEGKDLIREVPQDRWDWRAIYGDPIREPGKTWAKWGGFMPAVDRFDCRFFNIPPREAALMDPQHRLFLQTVWETVEDAGYRASDFAGTRTGLYVGVATNDYYELMLRAGIPLPSYMAAFHSMLANQISYLMDMRGPSEPIDTTCSSSLVAIHHAMASIQSGQCEMALAGGVNAILSPTVTTACSKAGMLAVDGRCKTFDERADGYVRGEGVGAVLLKPLDQAEADGDHIYAVVLGTAENHGGHAASLTAPNPAAQAELLVQVYEKAGVSPDTVGYIESHGTGTSLGDPIEINGLKDAFARLYAARGESVPQHPHCGLGSVKTNIGHLETAAGIIGVIKVLLALKHHRLPASLHLEKLNPYIQLEGSPFYIVDKRMAWEPLKDRQGNRIPRRAGVSSFGIGGVNAHAVLEEYEEKEFSVQSSEFRGEPQLIVLSAKNEDRLREYAKRMADFIEIQNLSVADIAYTLQVGREPMTERLAAVVSTVEEMRDRLVRFSSGESDIPDFFRGSARGVGRGAETLAEEEEGRAMIAGMMRKGKIKKLARLWVSGWTIDFRQLHLTGGRKRRLSLPPYPFAEERHWFSEKKGVSAVPTETGRPLADSAPLETHLEHRFSGSFFIPGWEPVSTELSESPSTDPKTEPGNVLILHNPEDEKMASEIFRTYSQERVYFIRLGKKTRRISDRLWETDCNDEAALKGCLANIPALDRIFHLGGIEHRAFDPKDRPALEESRKRGTLTLFRLVKCLDASGADRRPIQIRIVTHSVHPAASADTVRPGSAGLYGLARTVANEYPKFGIQGIDIDFIDVDDPEEKERIRRFLQHLAASRMDHLGDEIACRGERLYTRLLQPIRLAQKNGIRLRQKGIYLIAGGAGRIGFELSLRLARDAAARTVWIGRREPDAEIRNRMERIEGAGGKVLYLQADVTSAADMKKAVEAATSRFGNIQGAFHCATQAGIQMLRDMDEQTFLSAMRPKSEGSIALFRSLESEPLDFIMFFSSSQSFIGDRGLGHYAAACAFQDGLAHYLRQTATIPVVSVNWGLWKTEIGDASVHGKAVIDALGFDPIEPDEAMAAAWRILDHGISQVMFLKAEDRLYRRIGIKDPTPKRRYPERMPQTLLKLSDRLQTPPLSAHRIKAHRKAFGELEAIGRHRLLNAFNQMGILKKEGDAHAVADLRSGLGITPSHDQLFIELLNILKRAAFVEISGETIVASAKIADPKGLRDPDAMEKQQADLVSRFPEISAYAKLLDACIRRYPEILTGQLPATDVLFPDGSLDPVDHVYRDNETADHFNRQTARIVQAYLEGRETLPERDEKIRILEVGAGTGGTSRSVLSAVHSFGHRLEYMYTDVSRRFIRHGKDRFRQYPFLQFGLLNISEDPLSQGYQPDRYDMVIAANVIHATADLRNTLGHIKSLLKTNGWLVFNEVTAPLEFGTMTFGLLEGWWMFKDHACRMPGTPLLSVSLWQKLIEAEGFRHTAYFGLSGRHDDESDQHILVAESDGIVGESLGEEIGSTLGSPDRDSVMLAAKPPAAVFSARDRSATIQERIKECLAAVLELDLEEFEAETPFSEFGVDSILALEIINQINDALSIRLRSTDLFNYATIAHLTDHIVNAFTADPASLASAPATTRADRLSAKNPVPVVAPGDTRAPGSLDIAVIGMAGRFPDAEDVHGFWKNLSLGRDSISTFPESRSLNRPSGDAESDQGRSPYRWGGFLADIDCFDPGFFNMPPKEAELTDPQQRLFLQEAWHALEDAGYSPGLLKGRKCGVFAGYNVIEYQNTLLQFDAPLDAHSFTGNMASVLAARISYFLDLKGPSIAVNTACSSSLVAVHLACESIRYGTSDMALAGGVMVMTSGHFHEFGNRLGMLSPDGQCKTFDSRADGFVPGEGVGVVVLKPLDAAIRDGDHIYGTIIGSGINQDGKTSGITAPSAVSQAALEKEVYRTYGIQPETISYVEAHGTGTELGDPIEVQALTEAFREFTDNRRFCALGSVKTNIGHTTAAAGVAGLIKVLLCLKHGKLVPSLHFVSENRHFSLRNGPFYVNTELVDWNTEQGMPKRAAVSAFGLSGTNAHLVVEEYQEKGFRVQGSGFRVEPQLIVLSAKNEERLKEYAERIIKFLDSTLNSERLTLNLLDIAYTLQIGRAEWEERLALVVSDAEELKEMLKAFVNGTEHRAFFRGNKRKDRLRLDEVLKGRSASKAMGTAIEAGDIRQIAELWTLGTTVDWMRIHSSEVKPKRVSLPGYPFSKERYWVSMPTPSRDSDAKEAFQGGNGIDAGVFEELQSLAQGRSSAEDVHQLIRKRLQTT